MDISVALFCTWFSPATNERRTSDERATNERRTNETSQCSFRDGSHIKIGHSSVSQNDTLGYTDGLQSVPRESNDKDVATMLDNEGSFVIVLQHGGNDVTCKRSIHYNRPIIATFES